MEIRLFFTGDIVIFEPHNSSELLSDGLKKMLEDCDIVSCNLEAPIYTASVCKASKIGPSIYQSPKTIDLLIENKFNLFCLANNHIMDYGVEGLRNTINYITKKGASYIGAGLSAKEAYRCFTFSKHGVRLAIVNVAENGFGAIFSDVDSGYAWFGYYKFLEKIKKLRKQYKYVIVVSHAGAELLDVPLPEIRELYKSWIDLGVTTIIAHHPHVAQGWEDYSCGRIYYSLGNFAFDKGIGIQNPNTYCVKININENKIEYQNIYTKYDGSTISINFDDTFSRNINQLSRVLSEGCFEEYMCRINQFCLDKFLSKYSSYYEHTAQIDTSSLKALLKSFYFKHIKRSNKARLWLYHNIIIETHVWVCRRALKLLERE